MTNPPRKTFVIAVVNYKGGAGKTLTTVMLAWQAAARQQTIAVIDLDSARQAHNWVGLSGMGERRTISSLALDYKNEDLAQYITGLVEGGKFDLILLDTPANDRDAIAEALDVADLALIPVNVGRSDVGMLGTTAKIFERATRARPNLQGRILINQARFAPAKEAWTVEEVSKVQIPMCRTRIPLLGKYKDAPGTIPATESAYYLLLDELLPLAPHGAQVAG